jgi:hypothetical protein
MNVTALFSQAVWAEGFAPGAAARICSIARALGGIARRFCSTCFQSRSNAALFTAMDGVGMRELQEQIPALQGAPGAYLDFCVLGG